MKHERGFTLVELLVVIAIIAILSTLVVLILLPALARARDTTRKTDIVSISKAIETNTYDASTGMYSAQTASPQDSWFEGGRTPRQLDGSEYVIMWLSRDGAVLSPGPSVVAAKWRTCAILETQTGNASSADGAAAPLGNGGYQCGYSVQSAP